MTVLDAFIDAIADGDEETLGRLLSDQPSLANTGEMVPPPLHYAAKHNQPVAIAKLLQHGADLEGRDPDNHTTPLRYAVMYAAADAVKTLLDHGANAGLVDGQEGTAIELAQQGVAGEFESYPDLPRRDEYETVVNYLIETNQQ